MKRAMTWGIGALALAGLTLPASAADLGARPIARAPAVAPIAVSNWTGFYAGVGLGGRWTETDFTTTCLAPNLVGTTCAANNALFASRFGVDNPSAFDMTGVRVSGYLGYNWQIGNWVLGVEGDFGWADNKETHVGIPGTHLAAFTATGDLASIEDTWDASIRARLGFLVTPQFLLYATGGVAWINKDIDIACGTGAASFALGGWCSGGVGFAQSFSQTFTGWTIGGGFEWMFAPSWVARAEYRYSDYGSETFTFLGAPASGVDSFTFTVDQKAHMAYVGLSYLFNFGKGAPGVRAAY